MITNKIGVYILAIFHLLVDAVSVCCLFMITEGHDRWHTLLMFLCYCLVAFAGQPLVGIGVDRASSVRPAVLYSSMVCLMAGSVLTMEMGQNCSVPFGLLVSLLLGVGNAIFHVWGGKYVATSTHNDMRSLGVFVGGGAMGLVIGQALSSTLLLQALLLGVLLCCVVQRKALALNRECAEESSDNYEVEHGWNHWIVVGVLSIVFARSFMGRMLPASFADVPPMLWLIGFAAMAGKVMGGYLASWFGPSRTLLLSLMVAGCGYLVYGDNAGVLLCTIFALNMSMPITLYLANRYFRGREGFAFGLLSATLLPGYLLAMLCRGNAVVETLLAALIPTIIIETLVLLFLREQRWKVLAWSVLLNVLTNLPLNLYCLSYCHGLMTMLLLEIAVILVEAILYWTLLRNTRQAFTYSALCNSISFLIGLIFQIIFAIK